MSAKIIVHGEEARKLLEKGIDIVANSVAVTLGPKGRNVIFGKTWGGPVVTKDGVTVAREVEVKDPLQNLGAQLCKQVASKTNDVAGDGTTSATVLAQAMVKEGLKYIAAGGNPLGVKRGMDYAVGEVVKELQKRHIPVDGIDQIRFVASIAGNSAEIGETISSIYQELGNDAVISVEKGKGITTDVEYIKGMQFDRGYLSPHFAEGAKECVLDKPLILLIERRLTGLNDEMLGFLEGVAKTGKPIFIIADEVEGDVLATLVINHVRGTLRSCVIKAPGFGDRRKQLMEDLAILTGGKYITEDLGIALNKLDLNYLGSAEEVVVTANETTIKMGAGDRTKVEERIQSLRNSIEETDSDYDREKLQERLAKLSSGIATIKVGASSEAEVNEIKDRYVDAVGATKAALEEGICAGGGTTLLRIANELKLESQDSDESMGISIVLKSLEVPARKIAENAGREGTEVIHALKSMFSKGVATPGYDASKDVFVEDMVAEGIVDPVKVTRSALQNAASIASMVLTTEALMVDEPQKREEAHTYE